MISRVRLYGRPAFLDSWGAKLALAIALVLGARGPAIGAGANFHHTVFLSGRNRRQSVNATLTGYAFETIPNKVIAGQTKGDSTLGKLAT
jgi:hypothetical protein